MRTYRIMANLVEEAMAHHLQYGQEVKRATHSTTTQPSVGTTPSLMPGSRTAGNRTPNPSVAHVCSATATVSSVIPTRCSPTRQAPSTKWLGKRVSFGNSPWMFDATVLVIILGLAGWISLHQHVASTTESVSLTRNALAEYTHKAPVKNLSNTPSGTRQQNAARPRFSRVQVGPNEVDYVADDVTIRQFKKPVLFSYPRSVDEQFDIGDDVTVHTYKYKAEVLPESSTVKSDAIHGAPRH